MPSTRFQSSGWRLDSFLGLAREPIFFLAADRRIVAVNSAWEELTGFSEAEVVGLECRSHGPTRAGDLAGLGGSFNPPPEALAGQPAGGKTLIIRREGERIQRRVEFWPFHDSGGQLRGLLGIVRPPESTPLAADSERDSLRHALLDLRARMYARHAQDNLVGQGAEHWRVLDGIEAAARSTVPITITGEAGTGKRFVARLIHQQGSRRQMPLLGYDCQAVPHEILERELFESPDLPAGTTASARLVAAEGSTLVLGDILQIPRDIQQRLAASLNRAERPVRVIATTAGDLDRALLDERLRPDLYHAVTALVIRLRPLRDRLAELPLLAHAMVERANLRGRTNRSGLSAGALDVLLAYDWPGNLRELAKIIDDAHQKAAGDTIESADLSASIQGDRGGAYVPPAEPTRPLSLKDRVTAFERQIIEEALDQAHHNKTRAARQLGVNRPFLYRRIKELGIADLEASEEEPGDRRS